MYNRVTQQIVDALRAIVGEENVRTDEEALEKYAHDETVGLWAQPEVVVFVHSAQEIAEIFRLAVRERIPVTPRGRVWLKRRRRPRLRRHRPLHRKDEPHPGD